MHAECRDNDDCDNATALLSSHVSLASRRSGIGGGRGFGVGRFITSSIVETKTVRMSARDGRVALVVGAGSGIGRGCALAFARAGVASIVINDLPAASAAAEATAELVKALGAAALVVLADVAKWDEVEAMMATTAEIYGRLDIAVSNAAWSDRVPIVEQDAAIMKQVADVTQFGALHIVKAAAIQMKKQPRLEGREAAGKIVIISSISAFRQ